MGFRGNLDVALIVPVMKNFEGFAKLMNSVDYPITPIIIDNWTENRGVSWAWNEGIQIAMEQWVDVAIISNDDVVFEPGTINIMQQQMGSDPELDLLSAINIRDWPEAGSGSEHDLDYSCFMVRPRSFFAKFGTFDENFTPAYFEDNDMYRRIELGRGKQRKSLDARMYHAGSQTQNFGGKQVVTSEMFERNRAYYVSKWGGRPGEEIYDIPFDGMTGRKNFKEWVK